jgi:hypothetical protein
MSFGPLEFAAYLRRKGARSREPAAVKAARAAAAAEPLTGENILTVISGPGELLPVAGGVLEAARVFEAVAMPPANAAVLSTMRVRVKAGIPPLVLVLSSHHSVDWRIELDPGARLEAVLLAGAGESTVDGAGDAPLASIGGFYAFKPGSLEFRHLEDEVARCTRRAIGSFDCQTSATQFDVDG